MLAAVSIALHREHDLTRILPHPRGFGVEDARNTIRFEHLADELRNVGVFLRQQTSGALYENDLHAKPGEGLRQFAADRSAAEDEHAGRAAVEFVEDGFVGEKRNVIEAVDLRD